MSKQGREFKGGGLYRNVSIPVRILDIFIIIGAAALVGIFIFAMVSR